MSPRAGKSLVVVAIVVAVAVAAGGAGAILGPKLMKQAKSEGGAKHAKGEKGEKTEAKGGEASHGESGGESGEEAHSAPIVEIGEFLVNLEGGGENRYLRAEVSIRVSGLAEPVKKGGHGGGGTTDVDLPAGDLAVAKDCLTAVLSGGVFAQLKSTAGREKLKQQALERLQKALPQYEVHEVLFTSFVMQ